MKGINWHQYNYKLTTRLSVNVNQSPALVLIYMYSIVCLVSVSYCQVWQAGVVSSISIMLKTALNIGLSLKFIT